MQWTYIAGTVLGIYVAMALIDYLRVIVVRAQVAKAVDSVEKFSRINIRYIQNVMNAGTVRLMDFTVVKEERPNAWTQPFILALYRNVDGKSVRMLSYADWQPCTNARQAAALMKYVCEKHGKACDYNLFDFGSTPMHIVLSAYEYDSKHK